MTIQEKQHNKEVNYNNSKELDYVEEECSECGKHMINVKYIWYDLDSGNYICQTCKNKYYLNAVHCADINN